MGDERRWDGDTRGKGISGGSLFAPAAERLLEAMRLTDWIAEEPENHLLPHVRSAAEGDDALWEVQGAEQSGDVYVIRLMWRGGVLGRAGLRAEAYRLIGRVAELSTHVQVRPTETGIELVVTTGILGGDSGWAGHGHLLRLVVADSRAGDRPADSDSERDAP